MRLLLSLSLILGAGPVAFAQATFTVTTTADGGPGSLRQALLEANASPGGDVIAFAIPGAGPHTIQPLSALPPITDALLLDGRTQPGVDCAAGLATLRIELDGSLAGADSDGLHITANGSTVTGIVVNRFGGDAIQFDGTANYAVECSVLGLGPDGQTPLPNDVGLHLRNARNGVVGGLSPGQGNVIAGNTRDGIALVGSGATGNRIEGNRIGTDATGLLPRGNGDYGVVVYSNANTIGGANPAARNVIAANGAGGVGLVSVGASGTVVQGNYIGLGADGAEPLGNTGTSPQGEGDGVYVLGAMHRILDNVIGANADDGIELDNGFAHAVQGNRIGTDASGVLDRGNDGDGVDLNLTASIGNDHRIGGTGEGEGNLIAFNGGSGVEMEGGDDCPIRGNRLFRNAGLGIDLGDDGPTPNDPGDADAGPNRRQNYPEIASANGDGGSTLTLVYAVPSAPAHSAYPLAIEFFLADADGEEGRRLIGTDTYEAADAEQPVSVAFTPIGVVPDGARLVATATDADGNTSEFSASAVVDGGAVANEPEARPRWAARAAVWPNPARGEATLELTVPEVGRVVVAVYDGRGRRLALLHDGPLGPGVHRFPLASATWPGGMYVVRAAGPWGSVSRRLARVP